MTFGKLGEKLQADVIQTECIQFQLLHLSQCGEVRAHSMEDAGVLLTHHLRQAKAKGLHLLCLAMDIEFFFPSVNHVVLVAIMQRMGFSEQLCKLIEHYLSDRTTSFCQGCQISEPFDCTIRLGQGSCKSPIFSALVIVSALRALDSIISNNLPDLKHSLLIFIDNGNLYISTNSLRANVILFRHIFPRIASTFAQVEVVFGLDKLKLIHFPAASYTGQLLSLTVLFRGCMVTVKPIVTAW